MNRTIGNESHSSRPAAPAPMQPTLLQRKCAACGNHTVAGGECSGCAEKKGLLQRQSQTGAGAANEVPSIVHQVLNSSGQPLDSSTRSFMEPRFGRDFSGVRVHTDSQAAQSARAVNAHAYTVGNNVVFGAGRYEPRTDTGRELIAHELTHTIQQSAATRSGPAMQAKGSAPLTLGPHHDAMETEADQVAHDVVRDQNVRPQLAASTPQLQGAWVSCTEPGTCPQRVTGETERARRDRLSAGALDAPVNGFIVYGFDIGRQDTTTLAGNSVFQAFDRQLAAGNDRWQILGFSDCQGSESLNTTLRVARANRVFAALSAGARAKITRKAGAGLGDCVAANDTEANRRFNRSVVFERTETQYTFEPEQVRPRPIPSQIQDCEPAHARAIANARRFAPLATRIAANAIMSSQRSPAITAALTKYFGPNGPNQAAAIALRLHRIAARLPDVGIECEYPGSFGYNHFCGGSWAYVRPIPALVGVGNMHICQPQFHALGQPMYQMITIVHEGAHRFIDVTDEGYYTLECEDTAETAGLTEGQRRNNADCYSCLVQSVLRAVL